MTVSLDVSGILQPPASLLLPDTAVNDVLSVASGTNGATTVVSLIVVNRDSSSRKVTIWWSDGLTDYALFERSVAANETVVAALDAPLRLFTKTATKKIRAQAAAANVVTVTVIYTQSSQQGNAAN